MIKKKEKKYRKYLKQISSKLPPTIKLVKHFMKSPKPKEKKVRIEEIKNTDKFIYMNFTGVKKDVLTIINKINEIIKVINSR